MQGVNGFSEYPEIKKLTHRDYLFKQLQLSIEKYYKSQALGGELPALSIYRYESKREDDLLSLCAAINLPYDCIASLNDYQRKSDFKGGDSILIPNMPGIFIKEVINSDFDIIMNSTRRLLLQEDTDTIKKVVIRKKGDKKGYYFYPGEVFSSIERAFFFSIFFRLPLKRGVLTSGFGSRENPFGGHEEFHGGIDIAAPEGADVFASREGIVASIGTDSIFGNYIVLLHDNGFQTLYGHLSAFTVRINEFVETAELIGHVGSTGRSTGPHLHFSVQKQGQQVDPETFITLD